MYDIRMYKNARGKEPITDLLQQLKKQAENNKNARIRINKFNDYFEALAVHGLALGMPYIRHLEDEIWEIRPTSDRVLFFSFADDCFVMLHHFIKKTQKTPRKEIEQAKRNRNDYIARNKDHE